MGRAMAGFIEGGQSTLFSAIVDNYISDDSPVCAVDVFVDGLDLATLGFEGVEPLALGRPAYRPATMLRRASIKRIARAPAELIVWFGA